MGFVPSSYFAAEYLSSAPAECSSPTRPCHVLDAELAGPLLERELGQTIDELKELARMFGGDRLVCPGCAGLQSPLTLRGVPLDLCLSCGALWLDSGELSALTAGRLAEDRPSGEAPSARAIVSGKPPGAVDRSSARAEKILLLRRRLLNRGAWLILGLPAAAAARVAPNARPDELYELGLFSLAGAVGFFLALFSSKVDIDIETVPDSASARELADELRELIGPGAQELVRRGANENEA